MKRTDLLQFIYLTRMPGDSYPRRLKSVFVSFVIRVRSEGQADRGCLEKVSKLVGILSRVNHKGLHHG